MTQPSVVSGTVSHTPRHLFQIILIAVLVRLLHLLFLSRTAFPDLHLYYNQSDMHTFWQWSSGILRGDILGHNPYHPYFEWMKKIAPLSQWYEWWGGKEIFQQSPLYVYWIALIRAIFRDSGLWIFFWQLMLGALQPWIAFHLARLFFDQRTALIAALLTALYAGFIFHQGSLLRDWLPPLLEPLALLLLLKAMEQRGMRRFVIAGILLGLAVLAKERILLFAPVAVAYVLMTYSRRYKESARAGAFLVLGLFSALAPLIVRNLVTGAPPLALSNRAAEGFIEANAPDAFPVGFHVPPSMGAILKASNGEPFAVVQETFASYQGRWGRFLAMQWLKIRALFDPMEIPNNLSFDYGVEISPVLRLMIPYGVIVPLAFGGFLLSLLHRRKLVALYLYGGTVFAGLMMSSVSARQRLVLIPVLIIFAAFTLSALWELLRAKQISKAAAAAVVILTIACLQHVALPLNDLREKITYAVHPQEYLLSAQIYAMNSDFASAIGEMQRLRDKAKEFGFERFERQVIPRQAEYHLQWAGELIREGNRSQALEQMEAARGITMTRNFDGTSVFKNLGILYLQLQDKKQAKIFLQKYLDREPSGEDAEEIRKLLSTL